MSNHETVVSALERRVDMSVPLADIEKDVEARLKKMSSSWRRSGWGISRSIARGTCRSGMRQRATICRALVHEPRLLLMDEPSSALDAITPDEMNIAVLRMWERHKITALFVTHSIREAVFLSDRVLVMNGRPSTIIADVRIPFARPREFAIGDTPEFNALCGALRDKIGEAYRAAGTEVH